MVTTGHKSTPIGFACPLPLAQWLEEEAERRQLSKSRLIATILLEASGLDIELQKPGRPTESAYQKNVREIAAETGQTPIRSLRGLLGY